MSSGLETKVSVASKYICPLECVNENLKKLINNNPLNQNDSNMFNNAIQIMVNFFKTAYSTAKDMQKVKNSNQAGYIGILDYKKLQKVYQNLIHLANKDHSNERLGARLNYGAHIYQI